MQVDRQNFLHTIARGPDEELSEKYLCLPVSVALAALCWSGEDLRPPCVEPTRVSLALPADATDKAAACFYVAGAISSRMRRADSRRAFNTIVGGGGATEV